SSSAGSTWNSPSSSSSPGSSSSPYCCSTRSSSLPSCSSTDRACWASSPRSSSIPATPVNTSSIATDPFRQRHSPNISPISARRPARPRPAPPPPAPPPAPPPVRPPDLAVLQSLQFEPPQLRQVRRVGRRAEHPRPRLGPHPRRHRGEREHPLDAEFPRVGDE